MSLARKDVSTRADIGVTFEEHKLNNGVSYIASISDDDISSNPLRIKVDIPASDGRANLIFNGSSTGESTFTMTENPTGGASGGTSIEGINKRRDMALDNVTNITLTQGVSAPTGGTVLVEEMHGFDKEKIAGITQTMGKWILGDSILSQSYIFELESGITDVVGNLILQWYEHEDNEVVEAGTVQ